MKREGCIGGGELSGHFYFSEFWNADSGMLAGLVALAQLSRDGSDLANAADALRVYHQSGEINFRVEDKAGLMEAVSERYADGEQDRLDGIMVQYPNWWVNLRPSNTEPYLRLVMEADSAELLAEKKADLMELLGTPA